jgi:hypothetical protein
MDDHLSEAWSPFYDRSAWCSGCRVVPMTTFFRLYPSGFEVGSNRGTELFAVSLVLEHFCIRFFVLDRAVAVG